ncbi:MAG: sugar phosphate isomerase/epimerase [Chitinophagaceae bacterium]|nr:sugar phosphate isomerase/epimerase [Chitinophagaceae bacterium]
MITRRSMIKKSLLLASLAQGYRIQDIHAGMRQQRFKIGACDWSLGKGSNTGAFEVAKEIGLDGLMVDMGSEENNLHLRQEEVQKAYLQESARTGIAIASMALGIYNRVPFHADARVQEWVRDSIDAAAALNAKLLLLAFFNASDLRNDQSRKDAAVKHLKTLMPYAESKGVIVGIESYLNAREHLEMMDAVGSKNLKVYFDFRNTADAGFDPVAEFRKLGRKNVCELHMKENGFLLGGGTVNWNEVSKAVYDTGYHGSGWMHIEGANPKGGNIIESYRHNLSYLRERFRK